jgi:hypothetical protein
MPGFQQHAFPGFHFAQDIKITNCDNAEKTNKYRNGYL